MGSIEKRSEYELADFDETGFEQETGDNPNDSTQSVIAPVLRYWRMTLLIFVVVTAIGVPAVWLCISPVYSITGALRIDPTVANILSSEADKEMANYQIFVNTQAEIITSSPIVQRVADDLASRNLAFFQPSPGLRGRIERLVSSSSAREEPAAVLRKAIAGQVIKVTPAKTTELIKITMLHSNVDEARQIVNSFIRAYIATEVSNASRGEDFKLGVLEDEEKVLAEKLQAQREQVTKLTQEYGAASLTGRQGVMLTRVTELLSEISKVELRKSNLEAAMQFLKQNKEQVAAPQELLKMRYDHINSDATIKQLTQQISQLEIDLSRHKQTVDPNNPVLKPEEEAVNQVKNRLKQREEQLAKEFEDAIAKQNEQFTKDKLSSSRLELEQVEAYETHLRQKLASQDSETIELGRKQLALQEIEDQMNRTKASYDKVSRRIQDLEMDRKGPARISVAYEADLDPGDNDKRMKTTAIILFLSLAGGIACAFFRAKADRSYHTPAEVTRSLGVRVIGTTTGSASVKAAMLPSVVVQDYQTICTNLSLLDNGPMPRIIVITSPTAADGKTTFAVNLATGMFQSGKKTLLIDGDMRKPDIARLLNLPGGSKGLESLLSENPCAPVTVTSGLDVLASDPQSVIDAHSVLTQLSAQHCIASLATRYDHVIIDTPPVLAFPDALLLAKMSDAVILTSLSGKTASTDLAQAKEKITQLNIRILGIIFGNVPAGKGDYRYGYEYSRRRSSSAAQGRLLLLSDLDKKKSTS